MISEWFTDDELLSELASFFDEDERRRIDFNSYLGLIEEVDENTRQVKILDRVFQFDMVLLGVEEVNI